MQGAGATFGELLRRYRQEAGLSQEGLAERARLSVGAIAALERGRRARPRPDTVTRLAAALQLTPTERTALGAAVTAAPSEVATATPPAPVQPLIGRETDLAELTRLLQMAAAGGGPRLTTLTGPGGVGKTRLASAAAMDARSAFPDGVAFVDLSTVRDAPLVLPTIARTLRVRLHAALPEQARALLGAALRDWHGLLVLDNFEQVAEAALAVAGLLAACPPLVVLATSRMPLRVRGERIYEVSPLPIPPAEPMAVAATLASPAVALFVARAQDARPEFTLDEAGAVAVAEICRRLDGLPLAIELAAARLRVLPLRALATRLERRLPLLTGGPRDLPARQQTLRSAIAWSYDLLSPFEQRLFRQLAVFAGGCILSDLAAVCAPGVERQEPGRPAPEDALLDFVATLIDHGLLIAGRPADDAPAEPCFRMLETIREFAQEQLAQRADEDAAIRARHARRFLWLAEQAEPELAGPRQAVWLDRLGREHENFRAALAWSVRHDPTLGLRIAGLLGPYWDVRGYYAEGRRWFATLLEEHGATPKADAAGRSIRARALLEVGVLAANQGDAAAAGAHFGESLALYRGMGDRAALGVVLQRQGTLAQRQGDYAGARAAFEEALAGFAALGNRLETGNVLRRLGELAAEEGDYAQATRHYGAAEAIFTALGDRYAVGWLLNQQARLAQTLGDYDRATALLERSLAQNREIGSRRAIAWDLAALGNLARIRGDAAHAHQHLDASIRMFEELGDQMGRAGAAQHLGHLAATEGAFAAAEQHYTASLAIYRAQGAAVLSGIALGDLAHLARMAGDLERARVLWSEVLPLLHQYPENHWFAAWSLVGVAVLQADLGELAGATVLLGAASACHAGLWPSLDPDERALAEGVLSAARATLGEAAVNAAWARGRALSCEQALGEVERLLGGGTQAGG